MKIVADEGVEGSIVRVLREMGHEVIYIAETQKSITDREVLALAAEHTCIVLTKDKDFGELIFRDRLTHHGIVLIRLDEVMPSLNKATIVNKAFSEYGSYFKNAFSVITDRFVRIRNF